MWVHPPLTTQQSTMTMMFAANFEDRDDAEGTLLSSAAAEGEGGVDADRGFIYDTTLGGRQAAASSREEGAAP